MKNRARLLLTSFAVAVSLASCVTISQPSPKIRDYRLDYTAERIEGEPLPVVLTIPTLAVASAYDRESIVYREDSVSIGRYFYHRWTSNPGALIADLLERDFARSGLYTAVQSGRSPLRADYQLLGTVEEIEERMVERSCVAHLAVRFELLRVAADTRSPVVLQRAYSEDEPASCNDPRALSEAMSLAMARVAGALQRDVHAAMVADRGGG
jgi:ABC-type uncharacterized transport system auxiliary subunit